jgi:membrane-associated protein
MRYVQFAAYNVIGGVAWVSLCVFAGFFFGKKEWVRAHFETVLIAIVVLSVLPMAIEFVLARRRRNSEKAELVSAGAEKT